MAGNYVCAGFETIAAILEKFVNGDRYDNHFKLTDIADFFDHTCNKYLHSFGQNFKGKKRYDKYVANEIRMFKICNELQIFNKSEYILDSGGFQISIGFLDERQTQDLYDLYYNFLVENKDLYHRAFVLDIPPGPGCQIFRNFEEVYNLNEKSYLHAASMPQEILDKLIYIHHFRTPKLWEIYTKIMDDNELFDKFNYHGTGGIVANMSSDMIIPCIIYILPLIPLINRAKRAGRSRLDFHILGGATYRDVLFYQLFTRHIKHVHDIDVNITYDSSTIFKGLMVGRYIHIVDEDVIRKVDIRQHNLPMRFKDDIKVIDAYRNALRAMSDMFGWKPIPLDEVYCKDSGTFHYENRTYTVLYMLYMSWMVEASLAEKADRIYPLYRDGHLEEFNKEISEITRRINSGKITKKQKSKSRSVIKSLDMLTSLDENFCEYIVKKFLAKDEFVDLMGGRKSLRF